MVKAGHWIDHVFDIAAIGHMLAGRQAPSTLAADAEVVRSSLAGPVGLILLDLPFSVVFILAVFWLQETLGWITLATAIVIFGGHVLAFLLTRQLRSESGASALERMALLSELKLSTHGHAGSPLHSLLASRLVGLKNELLAWSLRASECQAWFDAANRGLRTIVQMLVFGEVR